MLLGVGGSLLAYSIHEKYSLKLVKDKEGNVSVEMRPQ